MLTALLLPFQFDRNLLKADLALIRPDEWTPHYNQRDYGGEWSGVALRSISGRANDLVSQHPGDPEQFLDTEVLARCGYFRHVAAQFHCTLKSVRLLNLAMGSFVREHTDPDLGYEDGEVRIHVPIVTDASVEFFLNGERLALDEGGCYYVNVSLPHRISNRGVRDRVHLVIDAEVNDWVDSFFLSGDPIPVIAALPNAFAEFREFVFSDPALQAQLHGISDEGRFSEEVVSLGREIGFDFHPEDVETGSREPALRAGAPGFGWKPIAFRVRNSRPFAEWAYFGRISFTEPFFEDTIGFVLRNPFTRAFRQEIPLEHGKNPDPAGFIFHMSRCGSTLLAQMLAALPQNTVISEAPMIDDAIRTGRPDWLCFVISALCAGPTFVKLDAWHIHSLPLIRAAFPRTPWVFLYRDPVEAMVSQLRRPGRPALPGALDPAVLGLRPEDITRLRREEWCAQVLAGFCESAAKFRDDPNGLFIDYRELPDAVWTRLGPHFGVSFSDDEVAVMRAAATRDAKEPLRLFCADSQGKQDEATPAVRSLLAATAIEGSMAMFPRGSRTKEAVSATSRD
jgi:Aspartyl/Asparaginyl beta-hydroxylase